MRTADERAGLRLLLLVSAGVVLAVVIVPLAFLVREDWLPLRRTDAAWVRALRVPEGTGRDLLLVLTQLGAPLLLELIAVVLAVVLIRRRRRALYVLMTVFGAQLLSLAAKHTVARVRPCEALAGCPLSPSFPSGHAVAAAAFWTAVAVLLLPRLGRQVWLLALLVPLVVASTRVLLGVHYPSDVVAGLLVGWSWAAAVTAVFAAWRDDRAGRDVPLEEGIG